jgi:hypothetical protein
LPTPLPHALSHARSLAGNCHLLLQEESGLGVNGTVDYDAFARIAHRLREAHASESTATGEF